MNKSCQQVSEKTSQRWWLVVVLSVLGLAVLASSVFFLLFPVGFQGGRNPFYSIRLIFDREGWDEIHLWSGIAMILVLAVHVLVHWKWIRTMAGRCLDPQECVIGRRNWRAQYNIYLDLVAGISFFLVSISGIYLIFSPGRAFVGLAPTFIFNWTAWDVIHTWSGIVMFISVFLHFSIHWGWIQNVSRRKLAKKTGIKSNIGRSFS